jgi:hypothetical protein
MIVELEASILQAMENYTQIYCAALDDAEIWLKNAYSSFYGTKLQFDLNPNMSIGDIFTEVKEQRNLLSSWNDKK